MAVGRRERRDEREARFVEVFGSNHAPRALDLLELVELAWHDCYGEVSPPGAVVEDMLTLSRGTIEGLISAAILGVTDHRDLKLAAEEQRGRG